MVNEFYEELFKHWRLRKDGHGKTKGTATPAKQENEVVYLDDDDDLDLSEIFEVKDESCDPVNDDPYTLLAVDSQDLQDSQGKPVVDVEVEVEGKVGKIEGKVERKVEGKVEGKPEDGGERDGAVLETPISKVQPPRSVTPSPPSEPAPETKPKKNKIAFQPEKLTDHAIDAQLAALKFLVSTHLICLYLGLVFNSPFDTCDC